MPPTKLPPDHHIVRNVSWGKLRKDENDNVIGVLGEAFKMRPVDDYLSATWLEYFEGDRLQKVHSTILAMRASSLLITAKSGFAIGNVGRISEVVEEQNHSIRILHEPEDDNKAHVAVRRWPRDDMELFELIATDVWSELILNSDISIPRGSVAAPDASSWSAFE